MRLTLYTEYALRVLIFLALRRGELSTIRQIAERYRISENHLMKIVHNLSKDGYIETVRGRLGGMRLAKSAKSINIGEIVRRYEDDWRLVECFDKKANTCPIASACSLAGMFEDALDAFLSALDTKTLADVLATSSRLESKLLIGNRA